MQYNFLYLIAFSALLGGCGGISTRPASAPVAVPGAPADRPFAGTRTEALLQALLALDVDYRYGGRDPAQGFDCSGLVAHVFRQAYGIELPHNARAQSELGMPIASSDLQPGDLVFYNTLERPYSHVGIYLGGDRFVHAPKAGARVRVESLRTAYWVNRFNGARRIEPQI